MTLRLSTTSQQDNIETYNGNPNLKARDVVIQYTEEQHAEIIRCTIDPIYFIEKYVKIVHVDHGVIPMKLYDFQKEIIRAAIGNRRVIVNASRQVGKTTVATAIILHYILFNNDKRVGLLANNESSAIEILSRIQLSYEHLPLWIQAGVVSWAKKQITLDNGCKVIAAATKGASIRGRSVSLLYIDEHAHIENYEAFASGVLPTISSGKETKLLLTSTPLGLNHFYSIFTKAKKGLNGFIPIEVPWYKVPGRDAAWKKQTLEELNHDLAKFAQEYEIEFMGSSGTLISGDTLKSLIDAPYISSVDGFTVYEKPERGHSYTIVCDVSRGSGGDYSAFQVIDITSMPFKQVATYRCNTILTPDYAEVIFRAGVMYNMAYILVEINDIGGEVANLLFNDHEYEHLLCTENKGRAGKVVNFGSSKSERGIRTTTSVKALGCTVLKMLIEQQQLIINDLDTISELLTFSKKGKSYEAESGKHDDTVMCLVLFAWLSQQEFFKALNDLDVMNALKSKNEEDYDGMFMPFGFNSNEGFMDDGPSIF